MLLFDVVVPKNSATFPPPPTIRQIKDTKGKQGLMLLAWSEIIYSLSLRTLMLRLALGLVLCDYLPSPIDFIDY
jgi:hypothetical protein